MGPFYGFYGAIMGLTYAKSKNIWSNLNIVYDSYFYSSQITSSSAKTAASRKTRFLVLYDLNLVFSSLARFTRMTRLSHN